MGGVGVSKGKWWFKTDVIYFKIGQANNDGTASSKVDMRAWIVTPSVGYNLVDAERVSLDVFGGARYLYLDVGLQLQTVGPTSGFAKISDSADVWDGIGGLRGRVNLAPKWYLPYYADVGTGESDLTWQAFAGIGYRFKRLELVAGYRYLKWEFDKDDLLTDLTVKGPQIGIAWKF